MNNRYISLKLEESVLQKIAKSYIVKSTDVSELADLEFSICKHINPSFAGYYAVAELSGVSESLENLAKEIDGIEILNEITDFEMIQYSSVLFLIRLRHNIAQQNQVHISFVLL